MKGMEGVTYYQEGYKKQGKSIPYLDMILNHVFDQIERNQFDFTCWLDLLLPENK